jgi:imidazolonepropionase-like amidohydrolase
MGLIIASVVNSMQESQILVQVLYVPMLFLSGTTIPLSILPNWVQIIAQFLPATHLLTGMQAMLGRNESLRENASSTFALILTTVLATFIGVKLFRWEKDEKIAASGKLWLLAVMAPFLVIGTYQAQSKGTVRKSRQLALHFQRSRTMLVRNVRIFVGDGSVIESGAVLIKDGKIQHVYDGESPDPKELKAEPLDAAGKTLLPGFIDVHVHLAASGGFSAPSDYRPDRTMPRALASYLYSGVMAVKSVGDPLDQILKVRTQVNSGDRLGAELFICGPMFTADGGHGTEYFKSIPEGARKAAEEQTVRMPKTSEEARRQVDDLKTSGVDGIKAILEAGQATLLFNRLDTSILQAIAEEARAKKLPLVVHTGDARDVSDALSAGTNGIEHGSDRDSIPQDVFARMKAQGVAYDPTLVAVEGFQSTVTGNLEALDRPLSMQVGPAPLMDSIRTFLASQDSAAMRQGMRLYRLSLDEGKENLLRAWKAGVMLVTGSDAGNPLVLHGPAIHRELQLWVDAGIPPAVALQAATGNAAKLLRVDDRIGLIRPGHDASMILVDGNPLKDIKQTEAITGILFKGERVNRAELFDQE